MRRVKRPLLIAAAVIAFLAVVFVVTRWLSNDTNERGDVVTLLKAQAKGDATAMLRVLNCPDSACRTLVSANARRLRAPGEVKIALYQSQTAHALRSAHEADARRLVHRPRQHDRAVRARAPQGQRVRRHLG